MAQFSDLVTIITGLCVIFAFLATAIGIVVVGRRRHVTVAAVSNMTGHTEFDPFLENASTDFRLAVEAQLDRVRRMVHDYQDKVRRAPDGNYVSQLPEMKAHLIAGQANVLASLLASVATEPGPAGGAAAQLQAVGQLLAQTRGATLTATLHRPDRHGRLGIAVETVSVGRAFSRSRVFRESRDAAAGLTPEERLDALLQAAARCAAIDVAAWVLQPARRLRPVGRRRRQEGLAHNMTGLLLRASSERFEAFSRDFLRFACVEFGAAKDKLPRDYQPACNLAAAYEAEAEAEKDPVGRSRLFRDAVSEYQAAKRAAGHLPGPAAKTIQRAIGVREARAKLTSGSRQLQDEALNWLAGQRLRIGYDCRVASPRYRWLTWPGKPAREVVELDRLTADYLYNSACMHALAAGIEDRADWDRHARRLLGTALVIDARDVLWDHARKDPDLAGLSRRLPEFQETLRKALSGYPARGAPPGEGEQARLDEVVKLVDDAGAATGWLPALTPRVPGRDGRVERR